MMNFDIVMATLPSDEDRAKMIALPYRIGLFISHADTTGGWTAQETEMQTLTTILRSYAEDFCKSAFVQGLLLQTLACREQWPRWGQGLDNLPGECVAAMYDLRGVLDGKELKFFQTQMMDIAFAVAQAFRENRENTGHKASWFERLLKKERKAYHQNVSKPEREALGRLADALDYDI
jgi:hypothetical protein